MSRKKVINSIIFLIVLIYSCISLYPLIWVVLQSFKTETEFLQSIWSFPKTLNFSNFQMALSKGKIAQAFLVSVRNTAATLAVDLVFITLAGFAFSKLKMVGKSFFYYMILLNMLIPTPIILLPMYLQVLDMNIQNTIWAIIFPYFQGFAPLGILLITNYFNNIPNEVIEAAKIDGCTTPKILIHIIVPLSKSMLVTLAILGGMNTWNEFMWALTSISETDMYPLSIAIAILKDKTSIIGYTPVFAALTISAMVFVVLYLAAQKSFVQSITAGAVKG